MKNNLDRLLATAVLGLIAPAASKPTASHRHQALHHAFNAPEAAEEVKLPQSNGTAPELGGDGPAMEAPAIEHASHAKAPEGDEESAVVVKFVYHSDGRPIEAPVHLPPMSPERGGHSSAENSGGNSKEHLPGSGSSRPSSGKASPSAKSGSGSGSNRTSPGIAYAPYAASGDCKSADQIASDFSVLAKEYSMVRIYGTDCDQVSKVYPVAKDTGLKLFLGIFEMENVEQQVQHIVDAVDGDWSLVDTISVGNELVNNKQASASDVISAMHNAKSLLQSSGYEGPVVTVDTFVAVLENPELCNESDYCAINIHPFFDGNTSADEAGPFITRMVSEVQSKLADSSQRIVVTETGWPWQGSHNRAAVPGRNQQHTAIESIRAAFQDSPSDLILFSAFNDAWKPSEANTFFAEQYWGIDAQDSSA